MPSLPCRHCLGAANLIPPSSAAPRPPVKSHSRPSSCLRADRWRKNHFACVQLRRWRKRLPCGPHRMLSPCARSAAKKIAPHLHGDFHSMISCLAFKETTVAPSHARHLACRYKLRQDCSNYKTAPTRSFTDLLRLQYLWPSSNQSYCAMSTNSLITHYHRIINMFQPILVVLTL